MTKQNKNPGVCTIEYYEGSVDVDGVHVGHIHDEDGTIIFYHDHGERFDTGCGAEGDDRLEKIIADYWAAHQVTTEAEDEAEAEPAGYHVYSPADAYDLDDKLNY